jgi:hypothetical protein
VHPFSTTAKTEVSPNSLSLTSRQTNLFSKFLKALRLLLSSKLSLNISIFFIPDKNVINENLMQKKSFDYIKKNFI